MVTPLPLVEISGVLSPRRMPPGRCGRILRRRRRRLRALRFRLRFAPTVLSRRCTGTTGFETYHCTRSGYRRFCAQSLSPSLVPLRPLADAFRAVWRSSRGPFTSHRHQWKWRPGGQFGFGSELPFDTNLASLIV